MLRSKTKVEELFHQEAILIGNHDGVPFFRAVALFGEAAAEWGKKAGTTGWNVFGTGDGAAGLAYLNKEGFYRAASWANVQQALVIEAGSKENDTRNLHAEACLEGIKAGMKAAGIVVKVIEEARVTRLAADRGEWVYLSDAVVEHLVGS